MTDHTDTQDQYDVPTTGAVHECAYCGRPFPEEDLLALHLGHDHPGQIDDDERAAFESAYDAETDAVRRYRIAAIGVIVLLYFGLLIVYALI